MREFLKAVIIRIDGSNEEPQRLGSITSSPFLSSFFKMNTDCAGVRLLSAQGYILGSDFHTCEKVIGSIWGGDLHLASIISPRIFIEYSGNLRTSVFFFPVCCLALNDCFCLCLCLGIMLFVFTADSDYVLLQG